MRGSLTVGKAERVDNHVHPTGAKVVSGGAVACNRPVTDAIHMPDEQRFFDTKAQTRTEGYYSTIFYELTHWTGTKTRCDRQMGKRFGDGDLPLRVSTTCC